MKKNLMLFILCFVAQLSVAQRCGCYENPTVDGDYYHTAGRMTASLSKINIISLSHGTEISPEIALPVVFKVVASPTILPSCKNTYLISVFDEKKRAVVYTTFSETTSEFAYAFPSCDRDYTVTMQVTTTNKTPIDPGLIANQDCQRILVAIVHPKCATKLQISPTRSPLKY